MDSDSDSGLWVALMTGPLCVMVIVRNFGLVGLCLQFGVAFRLVVFYFQWAVVLVVAAGQVIVAVIKKVAFAVVVVVVAIAVAFLAL